MYNDELLKIINTIEEIVVDEYLVISLNPTTPVNEAYRNFLEKLKYEYRWFGIRSENEFIDKWNDLREAFVINDSDFVDTSPSVQITILSNITQRLSFAIHDSNWNEDSTLCTAIARTICIYDSTAIEDEDKIHDAQIATTLSEQDIKRILSKNKWLVVTILINWISNQSVLQALGHLTYDAE